MAPPVPFRVGLTLFGRDQAQPGFMDERGSLQGLTWFLPGEALGGEAA
jgi:hypothetical protein